MAGSVGGQDEADPLIWLATRAGKMDLSCRSELPALFLQSWCNLVHIINPLLTKLVRSRWLDIGLVLFFFLISSHLGLTFGQ